MKISKVQKVIDAGELTQSIKEYFKKCIDLGKTTLDTVDTSAEIMKIIDNLKKRG